MSAIVSQISCKFVQQLVQNNNKEIINGLHYWAFCVWWEITSDQWIPPQRASNAGSASIPCRHHPRFCCALFRFGYIISFHWFIVPILLEWCHNKRHSVWDHGQCDCMFNHLLRLISNEISQLHHWHFVRGIHLSLVDSPHKAVSNAESGSMTSWSLLVISNFNKRYCKLTKMFVER